MGAGVEEERERKGTEKEKEREEGGGGIEKTGKGLGGERWRDEEERKQRDPWGSRWTLTPVGGGPAG